MRSAASSANGNLERLDSKAHAIRLSQLPAVPSAAGTVDGSEPRYKKAMRRASSSVGLFRRLPSPGIGKLEAWLQLTFRSSSNRFQSFASPASKTT